MRNTMEQTREDQIYSMLDNLAADLGVSKEPRVLAVPTSVGLKMYGEQETNDYDNHLKAVSMFMQPDSGEAEIPVYGTQTFSGLEEMTEDEQYAVSTPWARNLGRAAITGGYFIDEQTQTDETLSEISESLRSVLYASRDLVTGRIFMDYAPKVAESIAESGSKLLNKLYEREVQTTEERIHDEELIRKGFLNGQGVASNDNDWFITIR